MFEPSDHKPCAPAAPVPQRDDASRERALDEALGDTFPASDPVALTGRG